MSMGTVGTGNSKIGSKIELYTHTHTHETYRHGTYDWLFDRCRCRRRWFQIQSQLRAKRWTMNAIWVLHAAAIGLMMWILFAIAITVIRIFVVRLFYTDCAAIGTCMIAMGLGICCVCKTIHLVWHVCGCFINHRRFHWWYIPEFRQRIRVTINTTSVELSSTWLLLPC